MAPITDYERHIQYDQQNTVKNLYTNRLQPLKNTSYKTSHSKLIIIIITMF